MKLRLFAGGYCQQSDHLIMRGRSRGSVHIPVSFALLEHPQQSPILFDTGYAPHFFSASRRFPYNLYARITPVSLPAEQDAASQLRSKGIDPQEIGTIIISHFHADHIAGLKDFPNAHFICLPEAHSAINGRRGFAALRRGFLPELLPEDFAQRLKPLSAAQQISLPADCQPFTQGYDLLGDLSLMAVALPGHAAGQLGLLVTAGKTRWFLVADACWLSEAYQRNIPAHPLAQLLFDDVTASHETLYKLHQFHQQHPEVIMIPSHCPVALRQYSE